MSQSTNGQNRVFGVMYSRLRRWSVGSFVETGWRWPSTDIKPLSLALHRKVIDVDRKETVFGDLQLVTLHFDGEMEPRDLGGIKDFKGRLFYADPGDVIYSKIDVRNGAIGIVPLELGRIAVSSEYPVYTVDREHAEAAYIKLLFRTDAFRRKINSMISGASGRKRVQPTDLESVEIPLPNLKNQLAIVDHWQTALKAIEGIRRRAKELEDSIGVRFLNDLGLKPPANTPQPRAFAVTWRDMVSWSVAGALRLRQVGDLTQGKYPVVRGRDCISEIKHGCSASPAKTITKLHVLKISAVTKGILRLEERKYALDRDRFRSEFDLKAQDVLLCRTNGTLGLVGMSALVTEDVPDVIFPDKIIRVRAKPNLLPEFLWHVLKTPFMRAQIEAAARTAVGNHAIGTEDIWNFHFPLPPRPVQQQIMDRVRAALARAEELRSEALRQSANAKNDIEAMILGTKKP